jgi:hypothetical protein
MEQGGLEVILELHESPARYERRLRVERTHRGLVLVVVDKEAAQGRVTHFDLAPEAARLLGKALLAAAREGGP